MARAEVKQKAQMVFMPQDDRRAMADNAVLYPQAVLPDAVVPRLHFQPVILQNA